MPYREVREIRIEVGDWVEVRTELVRAGATPETHYRSIAEGTWIPQSTPRLRVVKERP